MPRPKQRHEAVGVLQYLSHASTKHNNVHASSSPFLEIKKKGKDKDLDQLSDCGDGPTAQDRDSNSGSGAIALKRLEREK